MKETTQSNLVTVRSIAIGAALIPLTTLWVIQAEVIWYSSHPTTISLFSHVTFIVLLLSLFNQFLLKRWYPDRALEPRELLTVYLILCISSTLCSHDFLQIFIPLVAYPVWNATPENNWQEIVLPHIREYLIVRDKEALRGFFEGNSSMYRWEVLKAWATPLLVWSTFIVALVLSLIFLNNLFRKQWTENEKLAYPVIEIPMAITTRLNSLLTNKIFWIGFTIPAVIQLVNGFHVLYPSIPEIPILRAFDFKEYLVERPWNAIGPTYISLYPFAIGLCFFLPTDMAFSCWFFFLFWRFEQVFAASLGVQNLPGFPYINQQAAGGYLGFGLIALWVSRRHLKRVILKALGRQVDVDESNEPMSYRKSTLGFVLCSVYMIGFGVVAGGSIWVMVVFFLIYFGYSVAIARMRAELGPPAHDLHAAGPGTILHGALGGKGAGAGNLTVFSLFFFFNRAYRAHISAHSLEGYKIGERTGIKSRGLFWAMVIALGVGLPATYWALLHSLYRSGTNTAVSVADIFGREPWIRLNAWIQNPQDPNYGATIAIGVGVLFAIFLAAMRMRFTWWVFHPVGYATSSSWSMEHLWVCMFIGWLVKTLILRYGGAKMYRPAVPFFVGLVLGDFAAGSLWSLYGVIAGKPVYHFWG